MLNSHGAYGIAAWQAEARKTGPEMAKPIPVSAGDLPAILRDARAAEGKNA